jgi:hypothetical protein
LRLSNRRRDRSGNRNPFHIIADLKGGSDDEIREHIRKVEGFGLGKFVTFTNFNPKPLLKLPQTIKTGLNFVASNATHPLPRGTQLKTNLLSSTLPARLGTNTDYLGRVQSIHPSLSDVRVRGIDIAKRENARRVNKSQRLQAAQPSIRVIPYVYNKNHKTEVSKAVEIHELCKKGEPIGGIIINKPKSVLKAIGRLARKSKAKSTSRTKV